MFTYLYTKISSLIHCCLYCKIVFLNDSCKKGFLTGNYYHQRQNVNEKN